IDRGLIVIAFSPACQLIGNWSFSLDEAPGVQLPPTPFVLRSEVPCEVLRPGQKTDVSTVLADGGWFATTEGKGQGAITIDSDVPASGWQHRVTNGRGDAAVRTERSQLMLDPTRGTRTVFRFTMTSP